MSLIWILRHCSVSLMLFFYQLFTWQKSKSFGSLYPVICTTLWSTVFHFHFSFCFHFHFYFLLPLSLLLFILLFFSYVPLFLLVDRETSFALKHRCVSVFGVPITLVLLKKARRLLQKANNWIIIVSLQYLSIVVTPGPRQVSVNGVKIVFEIFWYLIALLLSL